MLSPGVLLFPNLHLVNFFKGKNLGGHFRTGDMYVIRLTAKTQTRRFTAFIKGGTHSVSFS